MIRNSLKTIFALGSLFVISHSALAADSLDQIQYATPGNEVVFIGGVGYTWLEGNELVYDNSGNRISHLIWESQAPVVTGALKAEVLKDWVVSANGAVSFSGNSHMEDYDWLEDAPSYKFGDWSHQSIHPSTLLDRYVNLDIALGRDFTVDDSTVVNLHGGFKYTNVKCTSYGGSFIYSKNGFRNRTGDFPDRPGITFEQRLPGLFVGAEATAKSGAWTFTGLVRGGLTIDASDTDYHWLRNIRFEEKYGAIPFVSLAAKADYALNDRAGIFVAGNFDNYFRKTGDTSMYRIVDGERGPTMTGGAGMSFRATTVSAGLKMSF